MQLNMINNPDNLYRIAIVVVGYNRLKSLQRLLGSLAIAKYPDISIPLVICIDASGNEVLYDYVNSYEWKYGEKYVIIQGERQGLKKHIYKCADLTAYFKAIILLEDDLYVSPHFYSYVLQVLEKYGDDSRIAEISLYKNERNGYVGLPFENIQNGSDVFLMQDVSTWGECWTKQMWQQFKAWDETHTEEDIQSVDMPEAIKRWDRAWSKSYNAYVVDQNKYVLYPNVSLTTNFSDAGEHGGDNHSMVQVNLLQADFDYRLPAFEELVKYDIYFNNIEIFEWLELDKDICVLDLYGFHIPTKHHKYLLSTRQLPLEIVRSYALNMRPIELNVQNNIEGTGIYLYKLDGNAYGIGIPPTNLVAYYLRSFNIHGLVNHCLKQYGKMIRKKMHI